jgi:hypothetical protein
MGSTNFNMEEIEMKLVKKDLTLDMLTSGKMVLVNLA